MRTYDDIKTDIISNCSSELSTVQKKLAQPGLRDVDRLTYQAIVENIQTNLDNIDEVVAIRIGSATNMLIEQVKYGFSKYGNEFYSDFGKFMAKSVLGGYNEYDATSARIPTPSDLFLNDLAVTTEDLECLRGTLPLAENFGDPLRQMVNLRMGTNIPMGGVVAKAISDWENATGEDKTRAFVAMKEAERDSGIIRSGPAKYNPLGADQQYQEAKASVAGMSI